MEKAGRAGRGELYVGRSVRDRAVQKARRAMYVGGKKARKPLSAWHRPQRLPGFVAHEWPLAARLFAACALMNSGQQRMRAAGVLKSVLDPYIDPAGMRTVSHVERQPVRRAGAARISKHACNP